MTTTEQLADATAEILRLQKVIRECKAALRQKQSEASKLRRIRRKETEAQRIES